MLIAVRVMVSLFPLVSAWFISGTGGKIIIVGGEFDFGVAPQNSTLSHQVWIRSDSEDTIVVTDIKTSCGCLTTSTIPRAIPPGDSLAAVFYWQTRGSLGSTSSRAFVYTSTGIKPTEIVLAADVVTKPDPEASLRWAPSKITFSTPEKESETDQTFQLTNNSDEALVITLVEDRPELELEIPDTIGIGGTETGYIAISDAFMGQEFESSFTLEVTGNLTAPYRVSIPVVSGDFSFRPVFTTTKKK